MEADEKKCPQCAETVKAEAKICRFCGHSFEAAPVSDPAYTPIGQNKGSSAGRVVGIGLAVIVVLIVLGSLLGPTDANRSTDAAAVADSIASDAIMSTETASASMIAPEPSVVSETPSLSSGLTGPQENARRTAEQYLSMTGFSRQGLIDQLSSDAGNGYDVDDATAAVDSLSVDWNEQAARSARQYLDMTGFSCSGLIEQLSSSSGSQYTESQARYGAEQAGAC